MNACMEIPQRTEHLADAFSLFIAASDRLEESHRQLHAEVARLRQELEERNRALASSLTENERMRTVLAEMLDALPCGVVVVELPTERIVRLNPQGSRLLELPISESASRSGLPDWIRAAIQAALRSPDEHGYEQEVCFQREGKKRWIAIRYTRMSGACAGVESHLAQVILIVRDVTSHKNAEQEREAARNVFALAEVSAVLAHEIRNPLGSLELLTRCLAEDSGLSDESKQCVEHLQAGVRSLSATVSNVLGFHSLGRPSMRPLELTSVLRNSVEFIRPLAKQREVELKLQPALNEVVIEGEQDGLKQVFLNLLCNGLQHTPFGGRIVVTSRVESWEGGNTAVIEFSDTGRGISPENLSRIFDPGFSTTGSSGLGLAVCRRIVEQHRGTITVRSEFGHGATFQLEIPVV